MDTAVSESPVAVSSVSDVVHPWVMARLDEIAQTYANADPFPHVVIDDFFRPEVADFLSFNFPPMSAMPTVFKELMSYKGQLSDIGGKWPLFNGVFDVLQSPEFLKTMERLTGIPKLLHDASRAGGGLHQSPRSGFLDIHVDANFHPFDKRLHRRLNIIVYVSPRWESAWGGELQLWSNKGDKPGALRQSVIPKFNRAVIFSTTRTSWHGVTPVRCPDGESRRSLALYYYTRERPESELYEDSSVIWMSRDSTLKRALYPFMNAAIRVLKPYAKHLRKLRRTGTFDGHQGEARVDDA